MAVDYSGQFSSIPLAGVRLNSDDQASELRAFDAVLFDFLKVPPEQYAFQLTILDLAAFKAIQPEELSSCGWTGQRRTELSPNVVAMIRRFNQTSFWVQREVLSAGKVRTRAEVLTHFVKVARRLFELKNLHSLKAVVSALQATPIFRLQQTWQLVPRRDRDKLEELAKLVSEDDNYCHLRRFLETVRLPCLPYLGLYLTDIVFIDVAHPHSGGLESHDRKLKMNNILRVIAEFQRSTYDHLQSSEHICEYLLSNRFIEELQKFVEDDYYKMSLRLEPPDHDNGSASGCSSTGAASSSPPSISGIVEAQSASAEPVMSLNDSSTTTVVRRSSSSASCPLGTPITPSAADSSRVTECECSSVATSRNELKKRNRHKKHNGKLDEEPRGATGPCLHLHHHAPSSLPSCSDSRTMTRAGSSTGYSSSSNQVTMTRKTPALFSSCIGSSSTPTSSNSGGIDIETSARASRSVSESSSSVSNSSPSQRSQNGTAGSSANNATSPPATAEGSPAQSRNRSTPLSCREIGGNELLPLTAEEVIAEGPLLKKTLLRNGHRPTVARWCPYWAILYAPGSLLLYSPRRRLFSRLSQQQSVSSPVGTLSSSSSTAGTSALSTSGANLITSTTTNTTICPSNDNPSSTSSSAGTFLYSGGLSKWLSCSANFELSRPPAKAINLAGWMSLPCSRPRKPDLFLLQEPSRGTIYKMRAGSQAAALEWAQRLRDAIRKSTTINLISFE